MKEAILDALRREKYISGEELGKKLRLSRTAVWKYINELRQKGYQIDSSPGRGYSLLKSPDLVLPEEIALGLETRFLGRKIAYHKEVGSTQDIAKELARKGATEGTIVITESQTKGRGRITKQWSSPSGVGIYTSIILKPNLKPSETLQMPLMAGVAVCQAIEKITPLKPKIKWPNDIILAGKKVAGILTEMGAEIDKVDYIVLGIGINVNTPRSLLTGEIEERATSLAEECGEYVSRVKLLQCLLSELESVYTEFLLSGFEPIKERWKALDNTIGSWVKVSGIGEAIEGEAIDIDHDGALILREKNGKTTRIIGGASLILPRGAKYWI
jgi:BirA family biotin operon repressor/biotin-[acetyl-CoA-carboxylase] ligase